MGILREEWEARKLSVGQGLYGTIRLHGKLPVHEALSLNVLYINKSRPGDPGRLAFCLLIDGSFAKRSSARDCPS